MTNKRRDRLSMLEDAVKALQPAPVADTRSRIAMLEMIIPAEMAALLMLQRTVYRQKVTDRHVGPHKHDRPKTAEELRTEALQYQADRQRLGQWLRELRDLTGDDEQAWQARGKRLEDRCNKLAGVKGQA